MKTSYLTRKIGLLAMLCGLGCEVGEYLEETDFDDDKDLLEAAEEEPGEPLDNELSGRATTIGLYQAESFTAQSGCKTATNQTGYSGSGFVDYGGNGTWIELSNIQVSSAGTYTLSFRYATASGTRQCAILVNGTATGNVAFASTGGWTKWGTANLSAALRAGNNTVRILANTSSGGPNLDSLTLLSNNVETGQNLVLTPTADSFVDNSSTTQNHGSETKLYVDNDPIIYESLLKFSVPSLTAGLQSATLRVFVTNSTAKGPEVYLTTNNWSETGVTYANRPLKQGAMLADLGAVSTGWLDIDVTSAISSSGDYSFVFLPDSSDGIDIDSRQSTNKPQLVVVTGSGGTSNVTCALNPYSGVNWSTWKQYKANYHTHTNNSDGSDSTSTVVKQYYNADYDILSITDHNKATWPWPTAPSTLGMLGVKGAEYSNSEHMNAFFKFTTTSTDLQNGIPHVKSQGGMCQINHPGRDHGTSEWSWFIPWFRDYTCFGLEVYNQGDRYPNDRKLWDNINENYFKTNGRLVWGTSNDDKHTTSHLYRNFQFMIMPSLSEANLQTSMKNGAFYFAYEPTGSGNATVPKISQITVDNTAKTITIVATGANTISWVGPGTSTVATGATFSFKNYTKPFVRAVLDGSNGDSFTQPFGFVAN